MTGRRVENCFGKEEGTRSSGTGLYDVGVESLRVDDTSVSDGKDKRCPFRSRFVEGEFGLLQSSESGRGGET